MGFFFFACILVATPTFNAINGNLANYPGVTQQMIDDLQTFTNTFSTDLTTHVASQAQAKADRLTKDASRDPVESQLSTVRNLSKAGGSTEAAMSATGIPVASSKAPVSVTRPAARVDTSQRLQHTIHSSDEATPDNKKKPRGAMGAEIWEKFDGLPPPDETEYTFLTLDAFTPYVKDYPGSDAGKMAHYLVRWRMSDGSLNAWGETVSATITG